MISLPVLMGLISQCAPSADPQTMQALVKIESNFNPYAIAINYPKGTSKSKRLKFKQPTTEKQAKQIIHTLKAKKYKYKNYSVGLMQVNSGNFKKYGLNANNMFDACKNLEVGAKILEHCYLTAKSTYPQSSEEKLWKMAYSCYNSGDLTRGFKKEYNGSSYVELIHSKVKNKSTHRQTSEDKEKSIPELKFHSKGKTKLIAKQY